ncbi:MAG: IS1595 family transposase [Actinomycetota bacterium]
MSKADRNNPRIARGSEATYTFSQFEKDFPDDAACLDWLVGFLYPDGIFCPKCGRVTKHHRVKSRPSYSCQFCGRHEHPMKGTIFEDSATSLKLWFHAIYLMSQTRCGISAKQVEREIGVTYKTAWRMFNKIRSMLEQDGDPFDGTVEADEAYMGGRAYWKHDSRKSKAGRPPRGGYDKTPVLGIAQRGEPLMPGRKQSPKSGKVKAVVVDSASKKSLLPHIQTKVLPASVVYTDEWHSYHALGEMGYKHKRIHHAEKVYVHGDVHTQTIEGFWSLVKRGITGVYHGVSAKHLQMYLDEYAFRYNNRDDERGMFSAFLRRIAKAASPGQAPLPEASDA